MKVQYDKLKREFVVDEFLKGKTRSHILHAGKDETEPNVHLTNAGQVPGNPVHGRPVAPWKAQILPNFSGNQKD